MKISLFVIDGPETGKKFDFTHTDIFLVGRSSRAHLKFNPTADPAISRTHFLLNIRPPRATIIDLNSKNGTFVNGRRVDKAELKDGDEIKMGRSKIKIAILGEKAGGVSMAVCSICGKHLPAGAGKQVPDKDGVLEMVCDPCSRKKRIGPKFVGSRKSDGDAIGQLQDWAFSRAVKPSPPQCCSCGADLNTAANSDGLAQTFEAADYLCKSCTEKQRDPAVEFDEIGGYAILSVLGRGAMGIVYKAVHPVTRRVYAIKRILSEIAWDEQICRLFEREIEVQSRVAHPNLVRLVAQGRFGGFPFFVCEYLKGGSIRKLIKKTINGPIDPELACKITIQILTGLQSLHERGFIHRDIKPSNCLLDRPYTDREFVVKIGDYGLAKSFEEAGDSVVDYTQEGDARGSYPFIPPEQITEYRFIKPPADVYAAGATLYYLLTAKYPMDFPENVEMSIRSGSVHGPRHPVEIVLEEPAIPLRSRAPQLPVSLGQVVDRAVKKDVRLRYQTADAFRDDLEEVMLSEGWLALTSHNMLD